MTSTKRNSAARSSWSLRGHLHRLDVERLERVARPGREGRVDRAADPLQLSLHRAEPYAAAGAQSGARPPFALRRRDRGGRSGSRPTRPARSRCSARATAPSRWRATTTRSSAAPACDRAPGTSTRSASTASASGRVDDGFPASAFHTYPKDGAARGRVRLLPRGGPARAALLAAQGRGRARPRGRLAAHARRSACATSRASSWPDVLLMIGDQVYADEVSPATRSFIESRRDASEPPGERVRRLRGVHAALPRELERRRRSAGCSRPCRRR